MYRVIDVIDGDTFDISGNFQGYSRIRLAGVDAPERGYRGYAETKQYLAQLIDQRNVVLSSAGRASFGRIVCYVTLNNESINDKVNAFIRRHGY